MNEDATPHALAGSKFDEMLAMMLDMGASDLFLSAGRAPVYGVGGKLQRTDIPAPTDRELRAYLDAILTPVSKQRFEESPDLDVSYDLPGRARFRINLFMHQRRIGMVLRLVPFGAVQFADLNLPESIPKMAEALSGLILIVGPTGCGKSTTLASLVHQINSTRDGHIVTIEDPIEFVHEDDRCIVHQRQVGQDTHSFATALRHVVRQSPDVILIGEMRDSDTVQAALSAAMTGHLVLSTLHTTNVVQSIDRMLNYCPPDTRRQAQADLAATLVGIVSMRLLPCREAEKAGGQNRVPACEVLRATPLVRKLIVEGKLAEIYDVMKRSRDEGMTTLNRSLVELCKAGLIDEKTAVSNAPNPDEFRLNLQGMYTGIDSIDMRSELQTPPKEDDEE